MDFKDLIKKKGESEMQLNSKLTRNKEQSGITLIALVVTIVVLLILAGVSVNALFGNSGIIEKAKEAQNKMEKSTENDLEGINQLNNWIDNNIGKKENENTSNDDSGDTVVTKTFKVLHADKTVYATYTVEEGMTWGEWINSKYNTDGWKTSTDFPDAVISKDSTTENGIYMKKVDGQYGSDEKDVTKYGVKVTDVIDLDTYMRLAYAE